MQKRKKDELLRLPQKAFENMCRICSEASGHVAVDNDQCAFFISADNFYSRGFIRNCPDEKSLEKTIRYLKKTELPFPIITCTAELLPRDYKNVFSEQRMKSMEYLTGMIKEPDLNKQNVIYNSDFLDSQSIIEISADQINEWQDALDAGFMESFGQSEDQKTNIYDFLVSRPDILLIGYQMEGKLSGTAMVMNGNECDGIFELSVLPEYRRKRIASGILQYVIHHSLNTRQRILALQAVPGAEALYLRAGFHVISHLISFSFADDF